MIRYILFLSFVSIPLLGFSQKEWSLQDCIDYALKKNLSVKQSRLNSENQTSAYEQSVAAFFPTVNGNATHFYNFGQTIDRYTNQFVQGKGIQSNNFNLQGNVVLFNGLQNANNLQQNKLYLLASKYDVDKAINDLALNISGAYLQILFNMELEGLAKNQLSLTEIQLKRTQKLYDAGSISKEGLLNIESQKASEELSLVTAQNNLMLSNLNLAQMMDYDSVETFKVQRPNITITENDLSKSNPNQIYVAALSARPEIKSAELKLQSSSNTLKSARGGLSPTLTFSASIGTGYSGQRKDILGTTQTGRQATGYAELVDDQGQILAVAPTYTPTFDYQTKTTAFDKQIKDNLNKTLGFNLSIPITNNFQVRTTIQRAKVSRQIAEITLQQNKIALQKSIQQAYADASSSFKKYTANVKAVDAMQESFKYADQKFSAGVMNSYDYNTSKTNLLRAESNLLQAKYDYVFKVKVLEFYEGKNITFN